MPMKPISKATEPMDYPYVMFKQIMFILEARHETDPKKYATDVQGLECLLFPFWDDIYRKKKKFIENGNYGTWKTEADKWGIESIKATEKFKQLMGLINRCGLMPEGKFVEVWE